MFKETLFSESFSHLIQFGLNFSTPSYQNGIQFGLLNFLPPLPWERVNCGDIIVLRFVPQRYLAILFNLLKLKPDITCIDLTEIEVTISLFRAQMAEFIKW